MQPTINTNGNGSAKLIGTGPVAASEYLLQPSDYVVASEHGFCWQTLWNHPHNINLRRVHKDQSVLLPGDRLHVPRLEMKSVAATPETPHQFVRHAEPAKFAAQVCRADVPVVDRPYQLDIDGVVSEGQTDENGCISVQTRPNARRATLRVFTHGNGCLVYDLEFGAIDPITEISGVQSRLINLGYTCEKTGTLDETTKAALEWYQKKARLPITGEPDGETCQHLLDCHGG